MEILKGRIRHFAQSAVISGFAFFAASQVDQGLIGYFPNIDSSKCPIPFSLGLKYTLSFEALSYINKMYPQLRSNSLTVKCADFPSEAKHAPTLLTNYTDYTYNPKTAESLLHYLDSYANKAEEQIQFDYNLQSGKHTIMVIPRGVAVRTLVIIPDKAQHPEWKFPYSLEDISGATIQLGKAAFSYVEAAKKETGLFDTPQTFATYSFAVEACQQTLQAIPMKLEEGLLVIDPFESQNSQEIYCNSFGPFLAAAHLGISYDRYKEWADTTGIINPENPDEQYPLVSFSEKLYNSIPPTGSIIQ